MLGFNIDMVMFNSSCICFCELGFKRADLLTSFLADTEVVALWVCFHLLIYSHLYFWLLLQIKSDALDQNKYSYNAIAAPDKSYCI